jgi:branched-chain amino acid transport system permease protein
LKDLVLARIPFFQTFSNAHLMFSGALIILVVMFYPGGVIRALIDLKKFSIKMITKIKTSWKEYTYGKSIE